MKEQLQSELVNLQTKLDEFKELMDLRANDVRGKTQQQIEVIEYLLKHTKEQWQSLEEGSGSAINDIEQGVIRSIKVMQRSFDKIKQYFKASEKINF